MQASLPLPGAARQPARVSTATAVSRGVALPYDEYGCAEQPTVTKGRTQSRTEVAETTF